MLARFRHHLRLALVALATLAGLVLATGGASASCEAMKSARVGTCPTSKVACCCNPPVEVKAEIQAPAPASLAGRNVLSTGESCCCVERSETPSDPAPSPVRPSDPRRVDRGEILAVEPMGVAVSASPIGPRPLSESGPPHVPLFLRHSRFLI